MQQLWASIEKVFKDMDIIEQVEFGDSVYKHYKELNLFSYESSYFDRLILGFHLAMYGPEKRIFVEAKDNGILDLIKKEKNWRDSIVKGVDYIQLIKLIRSAGVTTADGIEISKNDLVDSGVMIGWSAHQLHEKILEMSRQQMLTIKGGRIIIPE